MEKETFFIAQYDRALDTNRMSHFPPFYDDFSIEI